MSAKEATARIKINHSLWWAMARAFDLLFKGPVNKERTKLGLDPVSHFLEHARGRDLIVAADAQFASVPDDVDHDIIQTAALLMPGSGCLEPGVEAFLRAGTPPVYVGFGSTPDARPAETARMVSNAVRAAGRRTILCGWAGLGGVQLASEVLGIDEAPHAILFPRVAAVVHHGGQAPLPWPCGPGSRRSWSPISATSSITARDCNSSA